MSGLDGLFVHDGLLRKCADLWGGKGQGGRGGGWEMSPTLDDITVLDVQRALHKGAILLAGVSHDHPSCPVERASNAVLEAAHAAAEAKLLEIYATTTLAEIARIALASAGEQAND
jgi:DNA-binding IscR family transcriptional regulator